MGGSEEAVYYTSIELARLGYDVTIYSSVTGADHGSVYHYAADGTVVHSSTVSDTISLGNYDDIKHGGKLGDSLAVGSVTWMQHDTYNPAPRQAADVRCEVFIAWRYAISLGLARQPRHFAGCGRKYLWLHDLIPGNILPPSFFLHFDGILVQSDFHKSFIRNAFATHETAHSYVNMTHAEAGIAVIPNGISQLRPTDENVSSKNNNSVFVYGSAPGRGLEHVLSQWGAIKKAIPSATLEVYYGFTDAAVEGLKASMGAGFERWYRQMQEYLLQDGVQYFGAVDHETLTDAYARAGMKWLKFF